MEKSNIPESISIRINTSNNERILGVKPVLKNTEGKILKVHSKFENIPPYAMTGDSVPGEYNEWKALPGEYILEVKVINKNKQKTDSASLTFTIR